MNKTMIIHDLKEDELGNQSDIQNLVFAAVPRVKNCTGCFGCWLKTPGKCVISDRCQVTPSMLAVCQELVIVSRLFYGGYSPEVKAVLDRSIGYLMPFFRIIDSEMHHTMRYDNSFKLTVHFYGGTGQQAETEVALQLVAANAINLGASSHQIYFHQNAAAIKEAIS